MSVSEVSSHGAATAETCPRCHTTTPWGESSWCPDCGYYPAVDANAQNGQSWADSLPDLPQESPEDDRAGLAAIPAWLWIMLGGIVGITAFSVVVRTSLPDDVDTRGAIALTQLIVGALSMLAAHLIAGFVAMKSDRRINFNDIMLSWFNVWQPTISNLPDTSKRIWAMVWGMVAVLTSTTIIGGIDYGAPFRTHEAPDIKPMNVIGTVAGAAAAQAKAQGDQDASLGQALGDLKSQVDQAQLANNGPPKSMKDALNELGDMEDQMKAMEDALDDAAAIAGEEDGVMKTINCFVYGVTTDRRNIPETFLFAANTRGQDQHVAEIKTTDLPRDTFRTLAVRLYKAVRKSPVIPSQRKAVWVNPVVSCRLKFRSFTEDGELVNAEFDAIVVEQRGRFQQTRSLKPSPLRRQ